jgi:transcriptional regulator with XRE-family HTH domain
MAKVATFANHLAAVREARGLGVEDVARQVGIDSEWYARIEAGEILPTSAEAERLTTVLGLDRDQLFPFGLLATIGSGVKKALNGRRFYQEMSDPVRLLVHPDEVAWLDRAASPGGEYDVFVNMSCATQVRPHLPLNTAAVLRRLGVDFAAGIGRSFCCGGYLRMNGSLNAADRMRDKTERRALERRATTMVHWCTACVNVFADAANRRELTGGGQPIRHLQILDFLAERLEQLGDDVPWVRTLDRRVVVHGHPDYSPVHAKSMQDVARVLRRVPGVEVVGFLEPTFVDGLCDVNPAVRRRAFPATQDEMREQRHELAALVRSHGADTVSCQHQGCDSTWSPFASVDLAVRHAVCIVAEALGCEHPDRRQAASLLGDPDLVVEQTRPNWTAWGISEESAREIAHREFNPLVAAKVDTCSCGRGGCDEEIIHVDVLRGIDWESTHDPTEGEKPR